MSSVANCALCKLCLKNTPVMLFFSCRTKVVTTEHAMSIEVPQHSTGGKSSERESDELSILQQSVAAISSEKDALHSDLEGT